VRKLVYRGKGFSLVELMIAIAIITALALLTIPIYQKSIVRAHRAEAEAALGSIRAYVFIFYGEYGRYPISPTYSKVVGANWNDIKKGELTGVYFKDKDYRYRSYDGIEYRIKCRKAGVLEKQRWLNEKGEWGGDW